MRTPIPTLTLALTLAPILAACAGGSVNHYAEDLGALRSQCEARDGILLPTAGTSRGRPELDYVCEISGVAVTRTR